MLAPHRHISTLTCVMLALAVAVLLLLGFAGSAYAASYELENCSAGIQKWDFAAKVVTCFKSSATNIAGAIGRQVGLYMRPAAGAMAVCAVILLGYRIVGRDPQIKAKIMSLLLRVAVVGFICGSAAACHAGSITSTSIALMDEMISFVSFGCSPWTMIDTVIARLVGFGPKATLATGMMGLAGGAMFSSSTGVFLFGAVFSAIVSILLLAFRTVYMYCTAVAVIALMGIISPLVMPMLLFYRTERYVVKWVNTILAAVLTPMLLFAFLSMSLSIFNGLINDIFYALGSRTMITISGCNVSVRENPDLRAYWKSDQPVYSWLMPTDPMMSKTVRDAAGGTGASAPPVQPNINPMLRHSYNASAMHTPGIDFGPNNVGIMQAVTIPMILLCLFAALVKSMIGVIPQVAQNIAQAASGVNMQPTHVEQSVQGMMQSAPGKMKAMQKQINEAAKSGAGAGEIFKMFSGAGKS